MQFLFFFNSEHSLCERGWTTDLSDTAKHNRSGVAVRAVLNGEILIESTVLVVLVSDKARADVQTNREYYIQDRGGSWWIGSDRIGILLHCK